MNFEQAELLARVAQLYFEKGKDQSAIARQLHVSRSSVSRLLTQARRSGIVEIRIHFPLPLVVELQKEFCARFGLQDALVLKTKRTNAGDALNNVTRLAARYLEERLAPGDRLAMSRGSTLRQVVEQMQPLDRRSINIVQLVGTLGASDSETDSSNLVRQLAHKLDGEYFNLTAPLFVENVETRRALLNEPSIREVLDMARHASIALVGIGALTRDASIIARERLLSKADVAALRRVGAVGEVCSQYFDENGTLIEGLVNERTIGLDLTAVKNIPMVIGVATGEHKVKAMVGALRGKFINVIITDDETAQLVLKHDDRSPLGVR